MFYSLDKSFSWARLSTISLKLRRAIRHLFFWRFEPKWKKIWDWATFRHGRTQSFDVISDCLHLPSSKISSSHSICAVWLIWNRKRPPFYLLCLHYSQISWKIWFTTFVYDSLTKFSRKNKIKRWKYVHFFPVMLAFFGQICFSYRHLEIKFPTFILFGMKWNEPGNCNFSLFAYQKSRETVNYC